MADYPADADSIIEAVKVAKELQEMKTVVRHSMSASGETIFMVVQHVTFNSKRQQGEENPHMIRYAMPMLVRPYDDSPPLNTTSSSSSCATSTDRVTELCRAAKVSVAPRSVKPNCCALEYEHQLVPCFQKHAGSFCNRQTT